MLIVGRAGNSPAWTQTVREGEIDHVTARYRVPCDRPDRCLLRIRRSGNPFLGRCEDTLRCLPDPRRHFLRGVWFQEANVLGVVKL